ncbi:hypothetical protein PR202_ga09020 [Eleusine coracana subsp. coracana]|uniref:Uncharacterized protein n=1 Tax=Eleusine coracana subsp. coracana TaxID=191504 RepID=A0AAV5C2X0_ELECO|nr:hypothetical protein PR202_ga09020 [Eleusine coracana subsp. coracana]
MATKIGGDQCDVCRGGVRGQATFTSECAHTFHIICVKESVACPVCAAPWKNTFPPALVIHPPPMRSYVVPPRPPSFFFRQPPPPPSFSYPQPYPNPYAATVFDDDDPAGTNAFNDDEPVEPPVEGRDTVPEAAGNGSLVLTTHMEHPGVARDAAQENFAVMVHAKGLVAAAETSARAPLDLVTVLDVSGSMAGSKLTLLKQAMGFVIDQLGPSDRLSVVTFSCTARRIIRLTRMSGDGKAAARAASGCYESRVDADGRAATVDVGELYAEEERRFLLFVDVPVAAGAAENGDAEDVTRLIKVSCTYKDAATGQAVDVAGEDAVVERPVVVSGDAEPSLEVARERFRVEATEDIAASQAAAERGAYAEAARILERRQEASAAPGLAGDARCAALVAELREMRARVAGRREYEETGAPACSRASARVHGAAQRVDGLRRLRGRLWRNVEAIAIMWGGAAIRAANGVWLFHARGTRVRSDATLWDAAGATKLWVRVRDTRDAGHGGVVEEETSAAGTRGWRPL